MWHAGQIQPADMLFGLREVLRIFEPIYTHREISHRKSNFLLLLRTKSSGTARPTFLLDNGGIAGIA